MKTLLVAVCLAALSGCSSQLARPATSATATTSAVMCPEGSTAEGSRCVSSDVAEFSSP
ncbi:MAG: hypothetical protein IPG50_33715 [Myxococcales bacterium]|nr:hypothetical protein [Myxococcales bacterium]